MSQTSWRWCAGAAGVDRPSAAAGASRRNGERLAGRRRLRDGDALRFGETLVQFRAPLQGASHATAVAAELFLSIDAVKGHLRTLFAKFGVDELPQMQKRLRLVERAFLTGS